MILKHSLIREINPLAIPSLAGVVSGHTAELNKFNLNRQLHNPVWSSDFNPVNA